MGALGSLPACLIASNASHAGKTSFCLALTCALQARGFRLAAAKAGPDFIDARYHALVSGRPVANLDSWMLGKRGLSRLCRRLQKLADADLLLVEGAMGLFDGGMASSARLAVTLDLPVVLLLSSLGMAESAAALAEGFLYHAQNIPGLRLIGLVFSHVGGAKHAALLRKAYGEGPYAAFGVPLLGLLPRRGAPVFSSRHLGLVSAEEAVKTCSRESLTAWCEEGFDCSKFLSLLGLSRSCGKEAPIGALAPPSSPHAFFFSHASPSLLRPKNEPWVRVAVACDQAFSFCYADLPALLHTFRARTVFFSPLIDSSPPPCDALYFPGGYPELFAEQLIQNRAFVEKVRRLAAGGLPVLAECGGFLYLLDTLVTLEGRRYPMLGLLPGTGVMTERFQALGYRSAETLGWPKQAKTLVVRGHEFHYARYEGPPSAPGLHPLWQSADLAGTPLGVSGLRKGNIAAGWLHVSPEGGRAFFRAWIQLVRRRAHAVQGGRDP